MYRQTQIRKPLSILLTIALLTQLFLPALAINQYPAISNQYPESSEQPPVSTPQPPTSSLQPPISLSRIQTAYHTDDWITDSRLFLRSAAIGVRAGMSRQAALESVTLAGAKMMDLGERIGSLEPGKDADFIVLSGDPLSVYTQVLETWIDGRRVFDRSDEQDRLWAVGGYGAGEPSQIQLCCFGREGWQ